MPQNRALGIMRLCLAVCVALFSALARGDALSPELRESRRKEIEQKSEPERARLQRNFKAFRELPAIEQDWLREFARDLKADDRGEGKLRSVMNEYYDWLSTLTPGQRDDLRRESDPARREKRVRDLLKKQQDLADATGAKAGGKLPRAFSPEDLDSVLKIIEHATQRVISPEEIEQLKKKQGLAHHTSVLDLAFRPRVGAGPQGVPQWWSKDVLEAMVNAVANPAQQHQLKTRADIGARVMILQLLMGGIRAEYETEYERIRPDQDTLERFFVQLSSEEQDDVMRRPFDQQQKKLLDTYMAKKSAEDPASFPKPPQFPWMRRLAQQQQQAAQRLGANKATAAPRAGENDGAQKDKDNAKKIKKDNGTGKPDKSSKDATD